jgi:hypothetical protein
LKVLPFLLKRNIKIYLKHMRNEKDSTFTLQYKNEIHSRHDIIICEILDKKKFYIILNMDFKPVDEPIVQPSPKSNHSSGQNKESANYAAEIKQVAQPYGDS